MRARNLSAVQYSPDQAPTEAAELPRYIYSELLKVQAALTALTAGHYDKSYVAPTKPRDGDVRYADGTSWKPNGTGGAGIWYYNGTTWIQLG